MSFKRSVALLAVLASVYSMAALAANDKVLDKDHEYMAVTNYPNNLHIIDTHTDTLFKTCTMPDDFGPGMLLISPDKSRAYVLNNHYADIYGVELDSCNVVFHAKLAQRSNESARSMFSMAVSPDGKELYSVVNPTEKNQDHYVVGSPRLQVYSTAAGLDAKPLRSYPAPRQTYLMQMADDGTLFIVGADIYKFDVNTGKYDVALPVRNWTLPNYSAPDVLYFWPHQTKNRDFSILYTTAKFQDDKQDMATAEYKYGYFNINLKTNKIEQADFASLTELYFSGLRSPRDPNLMFGVLNRLAKYDIREQKLLQAAELDHTYYCVAFNTDGSKLYLAGTFNEIAIFDPDSLKQIGKIKLPGGDMAISTTQVFIR
ncbi:quinohemoprotein amine dehydrogenase subunit beta [Pseudomonas sp. CC6-YY-74]|uniref:quinohemoprotein amine dehydrogenase subunit beta n=1 Tax=Pseudomonas sp. CC6-YY-74 TaxID=1930532 RepID=UPI0009A21CC4|nr:quinohemoprotein amine dehydrogenase subunit beta [Pseudomonas sp. CC6-YY-74]